LRLISSKYVFSVQIKTMSDSPRTQEQWLATLEHLQLPLNTELRAEALVAIDKSCSAADLTNLLINDPAAVLLIFREANTALARYERETHGLEHAISLLGLARVQKLILAAPSISADHPFTREYRQAQQRSLHAAWQARLWAEGSARWPADEMFWDALLAGAPHWLLWLEAGSVRLKLSKLRAQRGFVTAQESHELFGCDLNALLGLAKLATRWRLPLNSQLSWRPDIVGNRRDWITLAKAARLDRAPEMPEGRVHELSLRPGLIVALANLVAVEADWDWYGKHLTRLLKIVATCCRRPLATVTNFTHQTAAGFSRSYRGDLQTPGARLLSYWQQAQVWAPVVQKTVVTKPITETPSTPAPGETGAAKSETPAAGISPGQRQLAATLRRLQQPAAIASTRDAVALTLEALHQGAGLKRVAALIYRAETRELQTLLSHGLERSAGLKQLRLNTQTNPLLNQMLQKAVCLRLGDDNRARYWPLLPEALRTVVDSEQFLLSSIIAGGRPFALLFGDNDGQPLRDDQHRLFKQLGVVLGQCLEQMSAPKTP